MQNLDRFFGEMQSEWLSCTMSAAAGAEAFLNELLDGKGFDPDDHTWAKGKLTKRSKNFFKFGLKINLSIGTPVYQDLNVLCEFRHAILHFKAYFDDENELSRKLEEQAPSLKECYLIRGQAPFFAMRCVSSEYAIWSVKAALAFIEELDRVSGNHSYAPNFAGLAQEIL